MLTYQVEAQGDTVYVRAVSLIHAQTIITDFMDKDILPLCTFRHVAALPEGEEYLNPSEE